MKIKYKTSWILLAVLLVAVALNGCTTEPEEHSYRVGLLSGVDSFNSVFDGFKSKMAEFSYIEGETISYELQTAGGDSEKMAQIAEKFVADEVDLILTTTTGAAKAAQAATAGTDIPVIFAIIQDPVGVGLVDTFSSPGGNLTGVARPPATYLGKRVDFLNQMVPGVQNLLVIYDPDYSIAASSVPAVKDGAASFGIELVEIPAKSQDEIIAELARIAQNESLGFDAMQFMPDPLNSNSAEIIVDFGNQHGLPVVAHTKGQLNAGALFLYADDNSATGKIAATLADKIFNGSEPANLPVETSDLFLTVDLNVATSLGIEIPDEVLRAADEIIN